jgi:hypothetical protein
MNWWGLILVAIGSLHLVGCILNLKWYFNRGRQGVFAHFYGREFIRGIYALLGVALIAVGLLMFFRVW